MEYRQLKGLESMIKTTYKATIVKKTGEYTKNFNNILEAAKWADNESAINTTIAAVEEEISDIKKVTV